MSQGSKDIRLAGSLAKSHFLADSWTPACLPKVLPRLGTCPSSCRPCLALQYRHRHRGLVNSSLERTSSSSIGSTQHEIHSFPRQELLLLALFTKRSIRNTTDTQGLNCVSFHRYFTILIFHSTSKPANTGARSSSNHLLWTAFETRSLSTTDCLNKP